jgi:hypothetical protein
MYKKINEVVKNFNISNEILINLPIITEKDSDKYIKQLKSKLKNETR